MNETLGARAVYMEDHFYWHKDEMAFFYSGFNMDYSEMRRHGERSIDTYYTTWMDTWIPVHFLTIANYTTDNLDDTSPLNAFDQCYMIKEDNEPEVRKTGETSYTARNKTKKSSGGTSDSYADEDTPSNTLPEA